jgi:hypothetical protein
MAADKLDTAAHAIITPRMRPNRQHSGNRAQQTLLPQKRCAVPQPGKAAILLRICK